MSQTLPLVFDVHRFALDDGPGIRTTVFLKGCVLACIWCHNPESHDPQQQIAFHEDLCLNCGECYSVCPETAIQLNAPVRLLRERCTSCGKCSDACPSTALRTVGRYIAPADLLEQMLADRVLYDASGGGVTFSGGEPTVHTDYLHAVLKALKASSVHTAIETCGHFEYAEFADKLLPFTDLIMFDLKLMNSTEHERYTGRRNDQILDNFERLTQAGTCKVVPRIPLIPGITATRKNLLATASFLRRLGYTHCDLLPYDPGGLPKRRALNIPVDPSLPAEFMRREEENELRQIVIEGLRGRDSSVTRFTHENPTAGGS